MKHYKLIVFLFFLFVLFPFKISIAEEQKQRIINIKEAISIALGKNNTLLQYRTALENSLSNLKVASNLTTLSIAPTVTRGVDNPGNPQAYQAVGEATITQKTETGDTIQVQNTSTANQNTITNQFLHNFQVSYTKPLLQGGWLVAGDYNIQTKLRDLEAAHFNYFSARQDIINQVVIAYYSVISAKEEIKVNEQALKTAEESLKRVTRLLEEKLKTKLEMNQAEIQKAKSENDLINSKKRWADNLDKLAVLIGLSSRDELNIFYEFTDIIKEYDENKLIEDCISYRKELQTAMIKISQSKATYDYNKNQYLPAINYVAQYNSNYSPSAISGYFYYPGPTWYTGFQGQYNFFNLQDRENIKIANRELDLKKDDYRQKTEDFIEEVTTTLRAYRSYIELKKINLIQVKNAEESLEVAQKKYKEGLPIDYLNITKAQDDIVRAKNDLLNAEIRMILSQVNLERSAGYNLLNLFGVKDNYEK